MCIMPKLSTVIHIEYTLKKFRRNVFSVKHSEMNSFVEYTHGGKL